MTARVNPSALEPLPRNGADKDAAVTHIVVLTPHELAEIVRRAVAEALALIGTQATNTHALTSKRLTIEEAANSLRCSPRQVRRLLATGRLRATRIASGGSSRVLVTKRSVDALLAEDT